MAMRQVVLLRHCMHRSVRHPVQGLGGPAPEDVHLGFEAAAEIKVMGPKLEPADRLLVDVQTAADLHCPAVVEADLAVVEAGV